MNHTITLMTYDDIPQVAAIERQCFPDPWSEQMLRDHLDNQCAAALVAKGADGVILGYAGLLVVLDEGYITNVAVRPEHRRQGIGSDLLNVFENFARGNQLAFLTLEVRSSNAAAIALYQKAGYEEAGRRRGYYAHPREDAVIMTLWLKSGSGPAEEEKGEGSHADTGI